MAESTNAEEVQLIKTILAEIKRESRVLQGLKQLKIDRNLEEVNKYCEKSYELCKKKFLCYHQTYDTRDSHCNRFLNYVWNYEQEMFDYLTQELKATANLKSKDKRQKEVAYVLLYFLLNGKKPDINVRNVIQMIWDPVDGIEVYCSQWRHHAEKQKPESWWDLCGRMLTEEKLYYNQTVFQTLCEQVGARPLVLEYIIRKNPKLLFTESADTLTFNLTDLIPQKNLRQCIFDIRNEKNQTSVFNRCHSIRRYSSSDPNFEKRVRKRYEKLYKDNVEDLYELLSVQDTDGKTALYGHHQHSIDIIGTIEVLYNPDHREALVTLLSTRDSDGRTLMFETYHNQYTKLFDNHADELYDILSIQDNNGQTVFDVHFPELDTLLQRTYTPRNRLNLLKCLAASDNEYQTDEVLIEQIRNRSSYKNKRVNTAEHVYMNRYLTQLCERIKVLIICNTRQRENAKQEAESICRAFNYADKKLEYNLNKEETLQLIKQTARETMSFRYPEPKPLLIVVLLSHGSKGTIHDCDGEPITLASVEEAMCDSRLKERPKLLITQCCQSHDDLTTRYSGRDKDDNQLPADPGETGDSEKAYAPTNGHFCAIQSCVAGEESIRGVFIPKLANQIRKREKDVPIDKLFQRVCKEMKTDGYSQTPIMKSTLRAQLCLRLSGSSVSDILSLGGLYS